MFTPKLRIPEQEVITDSYQGVLPDEVSVQNWLNHRTQRDIQNFLNTLVSLNRIRCEPFVRMEIMKLIDLEVQKELDELFKKTESISFPVNEEYQALNDTLQQLLLECSVAYQIVIHDIAANDDYVSQYLGSLIPEALFMALSYLSRLLVERFQLYQSEPTYIWQELNQLFLMAERIGAQNEKIRAHISIRDKYLQVVILKLLNPYRLMRLEARKIYQLMEKWVGQYCDIVAYTLQSPENNFVVDLLSDSPPHYFKEKSFKEKSFKEKTNDNVNGSPSSGLPSSERRVLKLEKLRAYINIYLAKIEQQKQTRFFSYQSRTHNKMLQRINNELDMHKERSEERMFAGNEIKLVSGLRACHHFISGRKPFAPQDEIASQLEQKLDTAIQSDDSDINLISVLEEEKLLNKMNRMGELHSINPFLNEGTVVGDEWERIYAGTVINVKVEVVKKQLKNTMKEENWKQRNDSAYGMLLVSKKDIEMPIAVGMLVANRLNVEKAYNLGVVKWLRINPRKGMAIGVRLIAIQSRAIAVKGVEGAGAGGQFQQAFLISENDTKDQGGKQHLILPAGIYDQGSVLKIWHNNQLNRVQIKEILLATDSFEQVTFSVLRKKR